MRVKKDCDCAGQWRLVPYRDLPTHACALPAHKATFVATLPTNAFARDRFDDLQFWCVHEIPNAPEPANPRGYAVHMDEFVRAIAEAKRRYTLANQAYDHATPEEPTLPVLS